MQSIKGNTSWVINRTIYGTNLTAHARKHELRISDHHFLPVEQTFQSARHQPVWQRRFYDHVIRNQQDLYNHINYIHYK